MSEYRSTVYIHPLLCVHGVVEGIIVFFTLEVWSESSKRLSHLPKVSPVLKPEPQPDLGSRTSFSSIYRVLPIINAAADQLLVLSSRHPVPGPPTIQDGVQVALWDPP